MSAPAAAGGVLRLSDVVRALRSGEYGEDGKVADSKDGKEGK